MKRRDLVKLLVDNGFELARSCGGHDVYKRGTEREAVPRHSEINENLAKTIIKRHGLK